MEKITLKEIESKISQEYKYLNLTEKEYNFLATNVFNIINKNKRTNLSQAILLVLKKYILGEYNFLSSKNFLINYLNDNFENNKTPLEYIRKFLNFLKKFTITLDIDESLELIENSHCLKEALTNIYKDNKELVENNKSHKIYNNENFVTLMSCYCDLFNINVNLDFSIEPTVNEELPTNLTAEYLFNRDIRKNANKFFSDKEKMELIIKAQEGDKSALDQLVINNIGLVKSVAYKKLNVNSNMEYLDLVEEGVIGLITAIKHFDVNKKCKLSTYAIWWINQRISRAQLNNGSSIRLPIHVQEKRGKYFKIIQKMRDDLGREPTKEEIKEKLNISEDQLTDFLTMPIVTNSINEKVGDEEDSELGDFVTDKNSSLEDQVIEKLDSELLATLIDSAKLTKNEKIVLVHRNGLGGTKKETLEFIGQKLGLTRERVRQIEKKAMKKVSLQAEKIKAIDDPPQSLTKSPSDKFSNNDKNKLNKVDLTKEEDDILTEEALPALKEKYLENINRATHTRTNRKFNNLFDYFKDYDESLIRKAILYLNPHQQELIYKKYGKNLNELNNIPLKDNQNLKSYTIPKVLKRILEDLSQNKNIMINETLEFYYENYNKEYVKLMHDNLSPKAKEFLNNKDILKKDNIYYMKRRKTLDEMKDLLAKITIYNLKGYNLEECQKLLENAKIMKRNLSLYDRLNLYPKELINKTIPLLSLEHQNFLKRKYGEDLTKLYELDRNTNHKVNFILHSLKNKMNDIILKVNVLPDLPYEEIVKLIKESSPSEIKQKEVSKRQNYDNIFSYFKEVDSTTLEKLISSLSSNQKNILYKKYGKNLDECHDLTKEENRYLVSVIFTCLKRKIQNLNDKKKICSSLDNLFDYFKEYDEALIREAICYLKPNQQELIYKKYGNNLDEVHKLTIEERNKLSSLSIRNLKKILKKLSQNKGPIYQKKEYLINYFKNYNQEYVKLMQEMLTPKEKQFLKDEEKLCKNAIYSSKKEKILNHMKNLLSCITVFKLKGYSLEECKIYMKEKIRYMSPYERFNIYPKEVIDKAISLLSIEDQELLKRKHGEDLSNIHSIELNKQEKAHLNFLYGKIRNNINDLVLGIKKCSDLSPEKIINLIREMPSKSFISVRKYYNIFDYLKEYSKEEIVSGIKTLNEDYQRIIYKKYGENLNELNELSKEEQKYFSTRIITRLKRNLANQRAGKRTRNRNTSNILKYFSDYDEDTIKKAIESLRDDYKNVIYKKYGEDLDESNELSIEDKKFLSTLILPRLKIVLANQTSSNPVKKRKNASNILKYFSDYDEDTIKKTIESLRDDFKKVIYKKYGKNLDESNVLTKEEQILLSSTILPRLKIVLANQTLGKSNQTRRSDLNIFTYFHDYDEETVRGTIKLLNEDYQRIIYKKYGENLDEINELSQEEQKCLSSKILYCLKRLLNKKDLSINNEKLKAELLSIIKANLNRKVTEIESLGKFLDIYNVIPQTEFNLKEFVYLKFGYYKNFYFSLEEIETIMNINKSSIIDYYQKSLKIIKSLIETNLNQVEYNLSNLKNKTTNDS